MTLQSRSDSVDYGDDPGEASSSSKEVISFPLGTQSQVAISQEHQQLVNITNNSSIVDNVTLNNATATFGHNFGVTVHGNAILHVNGATGLEQHLPIQNGLSHNDALCCHDKTHHKRPRAKRTLAIKFGEIFTPLIVVLSVVFVMTVLIIRTMLYQANNLKPNSTEFTHQQDDGFFIPREAWGAVPPKDPPIAIAPAVLAIIKHTGGSMCLNRKTCKARVREIQREHMESLKLPDISYNFLIGGDERIYIGRGWKVQNEGRNDSVDIAFIGNFNQDIPTNALLSLARRLLIMGPREGGLDYLLYDVVNHNQTSPTDSPGANLFAKVTRFNHYSSAVCYSNSSAGIVIDYACPRRPVDADMDVVFWPQ